MDSSEDNIRSVNETLDVLALQGFASYPDVLERANAADADLLIAVTQSDEVNMVACQHPFPIQCADQTGAGADQDLRPIWADLFSRENMPIDVIISPELEVARAFRIVTWLYRGHSPIPMVEGGFASSAFAATRTVRSSTRRCDSLDGVFPDLHIVVVGIIGMARH